MKDAAQVESIDERKDHVNVIGHDTPGEEPISDTVEEQQAVGHDLRRAPIKQKAFAGALIEKALTGFDECGIEHRLLRNCRTAAYAADLFALCIALAAKPRHDLRWERIGKIP